MESIFIFRSYVFINLFVTRYIYNILAVILYIILANLRYTRRLNKPHRPQDTNKNLRAVDRMLDRYRDAGINQEAIVENVCQSLIVVVDTYLRMCFRVGLAIHII